MKTKLIAVVTLALMTALSSQTVLGAYFAGATTHQANNASNRVYILQAHREHIINPFTYITGTWAP